MPIAFIACAGGNMVQSMTNDCMAAVMLKSLFALRALLLLASELAAGSPTVESGETIWGTVPDTWLDLGASRSYARPGFGGMAMAKVGNGDRFKNLEKRLAKKPYVRNPAGLAAAIGRRKYGKERFAQLAAEGRREASGDKPERRTRV